MKMALIITSRCNAACAHCVTSCGPHRKEALSRETLVRLMDEAAQVGDGPLRFDITGGEPFLDFDLLRDIVAHGHQLGATVSCMTNAYWARSEEVAREKLSTLRDAGLGILGVSVSRFHEPFISVARVRRALRVAKDLGLVTGIKAAVIQSDLAPGGVLEKWKTTLDADSVNVFPVFPCLREGASLPEAEYYRETGLPSQCCPSATVCIEPDGTAVSCCGPAEASRFLVLGDAHRDPVGVLYERFQNAPIQTILRESGPIVFARAAIAAGMGELLRAEYAGPCDLCMHIGTDPRLRRVAEEVAAASALPRGESIG